MNKSLFRTVVVLLVVVAVVVASAAVAGAKGAVRQGPVGGVAKPIQHPVQSTPPQNTGIVPPSVTGPGNNVPQNTGIVPPSTSGTQQPAQPVQTKESYPTCLPLDPKCWRDNQLAGVAPAQTSNVPTGDNTGIAPGIPISTGANPAQPAIGGNTVIYDKPKATPVPTPASTPYENIGFNFGKMENRQQPEGNAGITPSIPIPPPATGTQQPVQTDQQGGQLHPVATGSHPVSPAGGGNSVVYDKPKPTPVPTPQPSEPSVSEINIRKVSDIASP